MRRRRSPLAVAVLAAVCGAAACAPGARAEITAEARAVVERYVAAAGGRAAFDSLRTVRLHAHVSALGLEGTTTTYVERPDRRASYTQLGPFQIPEAIAATSGWRVDPSGKLITLDGKDLDDARAGAWFENLMWLTPGEGDGRVRVAGTERDSAGGYIIVEVTPPVGGPRRYWFNRTTGLIDRESMQHDQQTVVGMLSDYRRVGGRLVPFRSVDRIVDLPANDLTIRVDSVIVNGTIEPALFQPPTPEASRITWLKTPGQAAIPFRYSARHVWVRASVNGNEPADFLFDTGASITILDSSYAAGLGLATQGELQSQGAGSAGSARFSAIRTLRIAGAAGDGIEFAGQQVGVLSINPFLEPFFWRGCAGVIGADFISRVVTRIDYDRETLEFFDPKTFTYAGTGASIPFVLAGNMPAVRMTLDGRYTGDFRVDVGSSSTLDLHRPFVDRNRLDSRPTGRRIRVVGGGFGGTFTSTLTRMATLRLGPFEWKEPMLTFSGASAGALASRDYAGNIGNQILQRFRCTFDYERRVLYLEPGRRFGDRDRFSRAGVQLGRYGDVIKAMQVIPGSPAARAGLNEGDQVTSIEGRPALEWTPDELQRLFEDGDTGRVVTLEAAHDGRRRTLRVKLADLL